MTRLNQSRRGLIGYTYSPQVCNDVAISTGSRQMALVQEQAFEQGMAGDGRLRDIVRGILSKRHLITKHGPAVIDAVVKGIKFMNSDEGKQLKEDFKTIAPNQSERINNIVNKYTPPEQYQNAAAGIYKGVKAVSGKGLGLAGKGLGLAGKGLGVAGAGLGLAGKGLGVAGAGLGLAGAGLGLAGEGDTLPGDMLKKKLLQKMVRERRMKSLGDRTKTSPVVAGFDGGSMVIPTRRGGQSKSRDLGKDYKLNPKPIVGGFIFSLAAIIAGISSAAAAAASAGAALAATTIIGTTTVGTLAGAALTSATGALITKGILGKGKNLKSHILNVIKNTKLTIADFPTKDKIKLKAGFEALKKNPTKSGIIALGKKMAPIARDIMKTKLKKNLKGMSGTGLGLAGGSQAKKFDNNFVKHFNKTLTT